MNDVVRDLAHDIDFEPILAAPQAVLCHDLDDPAPLFDTPAERHHDAEVGKPHDLADPAQGRAFQREARSVGRMRIARRAPEAEHRIGFFRLECAATDQARILVRLEVRKTNDHRLRIEGGSDRADPLRELLHKEIRGTSVTGDEFRDDLLRTGIGHLLGLYKRHRMNPDVLADDEFHPCKADAVIRQHRCAKGDIRISQVDHDRRLRALEPGQRHLGRLEGNAALVDTPDIPLGAGDGHRHACLKRPRHVRSADDRSHAEFPGNDRRMTGPAAPVGHDGGGGLHHRFPIRTGRVRDEHLAGLESREVVNARNHTHYPGDDLLSHGPACGENLTGSLEAESREGLGGPLRNDGFRARLDDVEAAILAVLRPFDIHRRRMAGTP